MSVPDQAGGTQERPKKNHIKISAISNRILAKEQRF